MGGFRLAGRTKRIKQASANLIREKPGDLFSTEQYGPDVA